MTILTWVILVLAAGWAATLREARWADDWSGVDRDSQPVGRLVGPGGHGLLGDIVIGILGAFLGGWLGSMLLGLDVTGLNVTGMASPLAGALIAIAVFRALSPARRA